jgi:U5 small nuclear ribonucleoprotein component
MDEDAEPEPLSSAIVLAEDKKYYPSADEVRGSARLAAQRVPPAGRHAVAACSRGRSRAQVYGKGTETLVMDEDAQTLEARGPGRCKHFLLQRPRVALLSRADTPWCCAQEPIVAAVRRKQLEVLEREGLPCHFSPEFLSGLLGTPGLVRNVAVVGHLHHGKTALMDMLVEQTHETRHTARSNEREMRYTDTRRDEQEREMSVKAVPMSLVMQGGSGKSYCLNLMDAPGHVGFSDEMTAALRLADGALLVVDAVEGVCLNTERALKAACAEGLAICVVITKVDRLIVELKLPPADAYFKLRHTLEELNALLGAAAPSHPALDPVAGNVAFSACRYGFSFTLGSFAALYSDVQRVPIDTAAFAARLWGDWYFQPDSRAFKKAPAPGGGAGAQRSFVQFILEPLYKIFSTVLGESTAAVAEALAEFGVALKPAALKADVKPLLKNACTQIFGAATGIVDMLARHVPPAAAAGGAKASRCYTGPQDSPEVAAMRAADAKAPLLAYCAKLVPTADAQRFDALCRVMAGTLKVGDSVRVLGEAFTPDDDEDSALATVSDLWVLQARYRVPIASAGPGTWVLVGGIDNPITKTATLIPAAASTEDAYIFAPLRFNTLSVVKIATEPLNPSDLPKLVAGLRMIGKSYPLAVTKVEESGEHTILGTGEIFLDSVMRDLRELYAEVEVKVADPTVRFCETCVETSSLKCFAETPNKRNKLTMVAEPLDKGLAEDAEAGRVRADMPRKQLAEYLSSTYQWDALAARSVWAFGPDAGGPNCLLDDTLPGEVDKKLLGAIRDSVVAGFQWGAREGPLCDEPMRGVKFKLLDATVAAEPLHRGGGQVIPTARRVAYSSFLMATPRLMEPQLAVEIHTPADCMSAIYSVLARRRGHVISDKPLPGTPIYVVRALLPAIESFGFETDLRVHTQGQAFGLSVFDSWAVVPGDPLDRSVVLRPLEPSPPAALARELMVKTRRRKGMAEDVSVSRFFDDAALLALAQQDEAVAHLL